jgi:hypothetical protein
MACLILLRPGLGISSRFAGFFLGRGRLGSTVPCVHVQAMWFFCCTRIYSASLFSLRNIFWSLFAFDVFRSFLVVGWLLGGIVPTIIKIIVC